jgi:hypothetical protein
MYKLQNKHSLYNDCDYLRAQDTYLHKAFGPRLADAEEALASLAAALSPDDIGKEAYSLYSQFRPSIPEGQAGWGKKGLFEISKLRDLV